MPTPHAESSTEALSPAIRELLSIFEGELATVQFPNVSAKILSQLATQVSTETHRAEALRQQLDAAQATLAEAQAKLVRTAELGLAYARVFAADDPELLQRLAEIHVGAGDASPGRRRKLEVAAPEGAIRLPAKRGRKPKQHATGADIDATGT
ncbi:hypothetical protein [Nannocystis sp.]|uniref:hypothetical protein n=1 Tax=Nannocystis sp. TaxID=1962667 RepID=UPI0025D5A92E|nr:hypothetical protein [Nannocystis sp.]MBK7825394.1 hypothetical protein [Nannocystis sp.]